MAAIPVFTKSQSVPNPVPSGSEVTYTIIYSNPTAVAITGVTITDTFDAGFTATAATGPNGVATTLPVVGPGAVVFNPVTVQPGASATFTVTGTVTAAAGATVTDTVSDDLIVGGAAPVTVITIVGAASADLAITVRDASSFGAFGGAGLFGLSASTSTASLFGFPGFLPGGGAFGGAFGGAQNGGVSDGGRRATFIATVTNNGPSSAANVQAVFKVKEGRIAGFRQLSGPAFNLPFSSGAFGSGSAFGGGLGGFGGGAFGGGFGGLSGYGARQACDPVSFFGVAIGTLAPGEVAVFELVVSVCVSKKDACAAAELFGIVYSPTTPDPDLSNNQDSAVVLLRREEKCKPVVKCCDKPKCGKPVRR